MAANYIVKADVYDVGNDIPKPEDVFLVDTNVWYWMTYTRLHVSATGNKPQAYQLLNYPNYTNSALKVDAKIYHSGLSLAELIHIIERQEKEIFDKSNPSLTVTTKEFRHNYASQRALVCKEIKAAYQQVISMSDLLPSSISDKECACALSQFHADKVDGYDLFILSAMKAAGIFNIITDDGDFCTVSGINVFTSNKKVLDAAKQQGKFCSR